MRLTANHLQPLKETPAARHIWLGLALLLGGLFPDTAVASAGVNLVDFTGHWAGWVSLGVFIIAYAMVIGEESLHLRKSKPVIVAAGVI